MFKGLFKFLFGLIRLAVIFLVLVLVFHTWAIKQAITFSLSYQLGADVSVRNIKMDWKNPGFEVQGLEIGNPYSFPKGIMANIPLVIVSVDLPSLPEGKLRLKGLGIDLKELQVMNVPRKGLNVLELKPFKKSKEESEAASGGSDPGSVKKYIPELFIDEFVFSIGEIRYLDATGPSLKETRFNAGIRGATYYDIRGARDVMAILVGEALKKMGFGYLESQLQRLQGKAVSSIAKKSGFWGQILSAFGGDASN
jgi:hypothetical protein